MSHGAKAASARHVAQFVDARSGRPLWVRAFNTAGRLAPRWRAPSADSWWQEARDKQPAAGEPTPEAVAALEALVAALRETASLHALGRFSAKDDTVRMARTHLRVEQAWRERPELAQATLPAPVFIVGWPRTGSTALHTLLAVDPRSRTLPYWESFDPVPPASGPDRRIENLAHRDPVSAMPSLCSLYAHTRAIFSDDVKAAAIGEEVMAGHWPRALESALALREQIPSGQRADVRHTDLRADPIATVERLYETLGFPLEDDARQAMQRFLAEEAAKPESVHEHSLLGFGLEADAVRERFRTYREAFDLGDGSTPGGAP
jgi:hypothetical protein